MVTKVEVTKPRKFCASTRWSCIVNIEQLCVKMKHELVVCFRKMRQEDFGTGVKTCVTRSHSQVSDSRQRNISPKSSAALLRPGGCFHTRPSHATIAPGDFSYHVLTLARVEPPGLRLRRTEPLFVLPPQDT